MIRKKILLTLATGFGLGFSPIAPGTVGSISGFVFVFALNQIHYGVQMIAIAILFFFGVWLSNQVLQWFEDKDPGAVTFDEMVSLPITFFLIPLSPLTIILGFCLNRALDIVKPFPAYQLQNLPKGWGIMIDDLISSIYSNILLHILIFAVPAIVN